MLGNALHVNADLYRISCEQATVLLAGLREPVVPPEVVSGDASDGALSASSLFPSDADSRIIRRAVGREPSLRLIAVDIPRTYPTLAFFHAEGPLAAPLHRILEAYACFKPDVGYIQGMSYLAGLLLLFIEDEAVVFRCFCSLLSRHLCFDLFRVDKELVSRAGTGCVLWLWLFAAIVTRVPHVLPNLQMDAHLRVFDVLFAEMVPPLHAHFRDIGLTPDMYLLDWLITLFTRCLPLDVAARVWDAFLVLDEVGRLAACCVVRRSLGFLLTRSSRVIFCQLCSCMSKNTVFTRLFVSAFCFERRWRCSSTGNRICKLRTWKTVS